MKYPIKKLSIVTLSILFFMACAGLIKPNAANFKAPVISMDSFSVPQYDGYWYFSKKIKPTKGEAGNHGAPLPMSFLLSVNNPNPYPVLLEGIRFTVSFEGFEVITVHNNDAYWIPAQKTDQIRLNTMITTRSTLLSLLVTGGFKLKEKGWSPWDALQRWWTKVPVQEIPVHLKEGSATFKAGEVTKVVAFDLCYPSK